MFLILEVTSANAAALGPAARTVFTREGGTIGRRAGNDWVLADPHVSGRHARVRAMGGTFFLEDNDSGNGVLVNGNRVHPGEPFPLKDGDVVFIDPFDITVRISSTMPGAVTQAVTPAFAAVPSPLPMQAAPPMAASVGGLDDLIGSDSIGGANEFNALLDTPPASSAPIIPSGVDLLAKPILHDALTLSTPSAPPPASSPPRAADGSVIPTNWDLADLEPAASRASVPVAAPIVPPLAPAFAPTIAPTIAPTVAPVVAPTVAQPGSAALRPPGGVAAEPGGDDIRALLAGAGLNVDAVDPQIAAQLGQVLRIVVEGLMEVLRARGEIKGEFRVQQTTFKPRENNPLKFSANVEDALHNLLVKRNAAYLDTTAAFDDAFVDVRHHQVAMLAGMRAAFEHMLGRFNPETLAAQFDARPGRRLSIGLGAGGRHWESFGEYYKEMTRDADDCFRRLFGDQFARAYEEQLQRLRAESRRLK